MNQNRDNKKNLSTYRISMEKMNKKEKNPWIKTEKIHESKQKNFMNQNRKNPWIKTK